MLCFYSLLSHFLFIHTAFFTLDRRRSFFLFFSCFHSAVYRALIYKKMLINRWMKCHDLHFRLFQLKKEKNVEFSFVLPQREECTLSDSCVDIFLTSVRCLILIFHLLLKSVLSSCVVWTLRDQQYLSFRHLSPHAFLLSCRVSTIKLFEIPHRYFYI